MIKLHYRKPEQELSCEQENFGDYEDSFDFHFPPARKSIHNCPETGEPVEIREKFYIFKGFPNRGFWKERNKRQISVTDYISGEGDLKETAKKWIFLGEPSDSPLKFLFICEALDLDVDSLRKAIQIQEQQYEKEGAKLKQDSKNIILFI